MMGLWSGRSNVQSCGHSLWARALSAKELEGCRLRQDACGMQVWDMRKFKTPVHVWEDLPAMHPTTEVAFSPDERLILTGVSAGRDGTGGALLFYESASRELVRRIGMPSSVVAVQWHAKLNQIFVGVGAPPAIMPMTPAVGHGQCCLDCITCRSLACSRLSSRPCCALEPAHALWEFQRMMNINYAFSRRIDLLQTCCHHSNQPGLEECQPAPC